MKPGRGAADGPRELLYEGSYLRLLRRAGWEYVERIGVTGIVGMVPITDRGEIVLVEQVRVPCGAAVVELPAGLVGDLAGQAHESLEDAARRELEEETGFRAAKLERLMEGPTAAGSSSSNMTLFLATGLTQVGPGGGDEDEDITVHVVPLGDVAAWLEARRREGLLLDPKIYAGLWFADRRA